MPDKKISELTSGGAIQPSDEVPVNRGGENFKVTINTSSASQQFTYEEDILAGQVVKLLSNGNVSSLPQDMVFAAENTFLSGKRPLNLSVAQMDTDIFVAAYRWGTDGTSKCRIITKSGDSFSFGSETTFEPNEAESALSIDALNSTQVVIAYRYSLDNHGYAVLGTRSGTSISFGSRVLFDATAVDNIQVRAFDDTNFLVAYQDLASDHGNLIRGVVSSGTLVFDANPVEFFNTFNADVRDLDIARLGTSDYFFLAFSDFGSSQVKGRVGELTINPSPAPATISLGTTRQASSLSNRAYDVKTVSLSDLPDSVIVVFNDSVRDDGMVVAGDINTGLLDVTFNSEQSFTANGSRMGIASFPGTKEFVIAFRDSNNNSYGTYIKGVYDNVTPAIAMYTDIVFNNTSSISNWIFAINADSDEVVIFSDENVIDKGVVRAGSLGVSSADDAIGVAQEAGTGGQTKDVAILYGVSAIHSGQTPNTKAYIQSDGTLGSTVTSYLFGKFISATKCLLTLRDL